MAHARLLFPHRSSLQLTSHAGRAEQTELESRVLRPCRQRAALPAHAQWYQPRALVALTHSQDCSRTGELACASSRELVRRCDCSPELKIWRKNQIIVWLVSCVVFIVVIGSVVLVVCIVAAAVALLESLARSLTCCRWLLLQHAFAQVAVELAQCERVRFRYREPVESTRQDTH